MLDQLIQGKTVLLNKQYRIDFVTVDDMDDIVEMLADPEVTQYLFFAPAPREAYEGYFIPIAESTQEAIKLEKKPENVVLTIRNPSTGQFAGTLGLVATPLHPGNFELGYQIAKSCWGQGLATIGSKMLTQIAFGELGAHKVNADFYADNKASERVLLKTGFVKEGQLKDYYKLEDGMNDKIIYGLTSIQYQSLGLSNSV